MKYIGIHFAGMTLSKTVAPGIVKYVAYAGIGGSGIVKFAISVLMACHFLVNTVRIARVSKQDHTRPRWEGSERLLVAILLRHSDEKLQNACLWNLIK